jgi:hypothetical protein
MNISSFNQMRLETHKYCNIVRFDMENSICPVNPLEDKFLIGSIFKYTLNQRIIEVFEFMHMVCFKDCKLTKM